MVELSIKDRISSLNNLVSLHGRDFNFIMVWNVKRDIKKIDPIVCIW